MLKSSQLLISCIVTFVFLVACSEAASEQSSLNLNIEEISKVADENKSVPSALIENSLIKENSQCKGAVSTRIFDAKNNYKLEKVPGDTIINSISIDLNADDYCDLIVEYNSSISFCNNDIKASECTDIREYFYSDFYLGKANKEFVLDQKGVERQRWTSNGMYRSYNYKNEPKPYIVWDLHGQGRVEKFANSNLIFIWNNSIEVLNVDDVYEYSVLDKREIAETILQYHNKKYP